MVPKAPRNHFRNSKTKGRLERSALRSVLANFGLQTDPWGIKVTAVEVRDVILPDSMKRAMAGQAESERERHAKIINAEAEFQAAQKLVQAASMISAQPIALQLRFLQRMKEISSEHNTTTILPCRLICLRR